MLSDPIFDVFPEPDERRRVLEVEAHDANREDRIIQKQYPMLYVNLNASHHGDIADIQCEMPEECPLCQLDKNTLDSLKVLLPHEVRDYLISCNYTFTQEQVNVHLSHASDLGENVIGVLQNMTIDLISKSYTLANKASLRIMNRVTTHMGRPILIADQDIAKVHNDAVKQFIGLTSTCQALMKHKTSEGAEKISVINSLL